MSGAKLFEAVAEGLLRAKQNREFLDQHHAPQSSYCGISQGLKYQYVLKIEVRTIRGMISCEHDGTNAHESQKTLYMCYCPFYVSSPLLPYRLPSAGDQPVVPAARQKAEPVSIR